MQQTPDDTRPGRAVPETAEKHDDDEIQRHSKRTNLSAAERNVEVIAQECRKRNVPAPPKIGETDRGVGKTEIVLKMKAERQCGADCSQRIAGEIAKDLSGEREHARPRIE